MATTTIPESMTHAEVRRAQRDAWRAIAAIFLISGFALSSWISRIPTITDKLDLSTGHVGTALMAIAAGAIIAFPTTGRFVDTLGSGTELMWGSNPPQQLADTMHAAWVAFATNGHCSWPQYDLTRRSTIRFDVKSAVVDDPRRAERALWEERFS